MDKWKRRAFAPEVDPDIDAIEATRESNSAVQQVSVFVRGRHLLRLGLLRERSGGTE